MTAYVGLAVLALGSPAGEDERAGPVERAARWLTAAARPGGCWGYNANAPPDTDSTAHAVLFLGAAGCPVPAESRDRLLERQRPDGAVATFARRDPAHSWGCGHPDVTPLALLALRAWLPWEAPQLRRGCASVATGIGGDGLWRSFWWTTPLYATAVSVRLLEASGTPYARARAYAGLAAARTTCAFELALRADALALLAPSATATQAAAQELIAAQLPDGSWASAPILRVTDPAQPAPWDAADAGPVVADQERLFTTATALRALAATPGPDIGRR